MKRDIVVFELIQEKDTAVLDFRLMRQALPAGACPLAIADGPEFTTHTGQYFLSDEVEAFARQQSGYQREE